MQNKYRYQTLFAAIIIAVYGLTTIYPSYAGEGHGHGSQEKTKEKTEEKGHEHEDAEEGHDDEHGEEAHLSDKAIEDSGIQLMQVSSGEVDQMLSLTGRITLNQNKTASVKARFAGIVRNVFKSQGDVVKAGDILASVESNESLQVYHVTAPIDGVVLSRSINIGDTAAESAMFTIADMNELWAEFHVFSQDADHVVAGDPVIVSTSECEKTQEAIIQSLLPITEASSQTLLARTTIKNLDSHWLPGMSVRGEVIVDERHVPLAVRTSALQQMEGQSVVFVKEGEGFKARPVKTGLQNKQWTEITEGLKNGETYVSEGSFIVKAEIGKASAEHAH